MKEQSLSAFIYQETYKKSEEYYTRKTIKNNIEKNEKILDRSTLAITRSEKNKQTTERGPSRMVVRHGEDVATLIAMLHDAIQKKQNYPNSALAMQRQGRVKVAFKLFKDGRITNLRILQGSGTASLDRAAIAAVSEAAPFSHLTHYILASDEYQIDIVFELT